VAQGLLEPLYSVYKSYAPHMIFSTAHMIQEYKKSLQCLSQHNYDQMKCGDFFDEYRKCKKEWVSVVYCVV